MFSSSTSLILKSDEKITERSVYSMKTIRTERSNSIKKKQKEKKIESYSQALPYQENTFQQLKQIQGQNRILELHSLKSNPKGVQVPEKNENKMEKKLIAKRIYSKQLEEKQKEFIKLIAICMIFLIILVVIFHKKEPDKIQSLF